MEDEEWGLLGNEWEMMIMIMKVAVDLGLNITHRCEIEGLDAEFKRNILLTNRQPGQTGKLRRKRKTNASVEPVSLKSMYLIV